MKIETFITLKNEARRYSKGVVTVEFAFVIVLFLLIIAGIFGFGRTFWYADALTKSTRDGARLLSTWPKASINSVGIDAALTITANSANAANISPQLVATTHVQAVCLDSAFATVACVDGVTPINVRVSITGFSVMLGEWFPFISTTGVINYGIVNLSPHTTMRYMN